MEGLGESIDARYSTTYIARKAKRQPLISRMGDCAWHAKDHKQLVTNSNQHYPH
jgi:hypothetical protein